MYVHVAVQPNFTLLPYTIDGFVSGEFMPWGIASTETGNAYFW